MAFWPLHSMRIAIFVFLTFVYDRTLSHDKLSLSAGCSCAERTGWWASLCPVRVKRRELDIVARAVVAVIAG